MFSIPWKHAARHGWEVDKDACLFKQWAIHTGEDRSSTHKHTRSTTGVLKPCLCSSGKYKEGVTNPDPKTWKANFRCAMNSLPDIEEVKDKSINKGCGAVRVYRMLPTVTKKKMKRSKSRDSRKRKVSVCQRVCSTGDHLQQVQSIKDVCMCVQIKTEDADVHEMHSEMTQENTIDSTVNLSKPAQI